MNTQLKKGSLELCVLCLLQGRDYYGFELAAAIPKEISITEGTVYPLLKRMQESGLLGVYWAESQGGPPRKYYRISERGRVTFGTLRSEWHAFSRAIDRMLLESERHETARDDQGKEGQHDE